jgi:DNA topoisomerase IB
LGIDYNVLFRYVKKNIGLIYVPKDLRTFCANVNAWRVIEKYLDRPLPEMKSDANAEVREIVETVAERLGNTPPVTKRNYLDERMLNWFIEQRWPSEV